MTHEPYPRDFLVCQRCNRQAIACSFNDYRPTRGLFSSIFLYSATRTDPRSFFKRLNYIRDRFFSLSSPGRDIGKDTGQFVCSKLCLPLNFSLSVENPRDPNSPPAGLRSRVSILAAFLNRAVPVVNQLCTTKELSRKQG